MPPAAPNQAKTAPEPPRKNAPPSRPPEPQPPAPENTPPESRAALFRALVDAGSDAPVAYTATRETESMVAESVAAQVQPLAVEMRQLFREQGQAIAKQERRLDSLEADVRGLKETVSVKMDALKVEMRLMWGALGVLVTVQIAILGVLLTS